MGQGSSNTLNPEILQIRINKSNNLLKKRKSVKEVYSSMVSRVLQNPKEESFSLAKLPDSIIFCILEYLPSEIPVLLLVSAV